MKRSYIIILIIQFVFVLALLIFAMIQKAEAEVQRQATQANAIEASKLAQLAFNNELQLKEEKHRADSLQEELDRMITTKRK